ncbi:MAG: hypothetical protein V7647_1108, partial [Acidobacteriota bacterium]
TAANVAAEGRIWTFTTAGTAPPNSPPPPPDSAAPSVNVYAPGNNATVAGGIDVYASASDNVAVAGVQFKLDGFILGAEDRSAPFKITWDTRTASNGQHRLSAVARDAAGNSATATDVMVTVTNDVPPPDTTPPSVSITLPADGQTVSGTLQISADSSDNVGVAGVQLQVDRTPVGAEDTVAPYAFSWITTSTPNGTYTLTAVARDAAGNVATSAPVRVVVSNGGPPPPADVVLRGGDVPTSLVGNWVPFSDATAAGGTALWNVDHGAAKIAPALVTPKAYVEFKFDAVPNTPYHLWVRMRAQNDYYGNDSIHVQFSDAVTSTGAPVYGIGSISSAEVVLQETDLGTISGWGWADQGWNGKGNPIVFSSSDTHTIRIQQREDGVFIDQIVLSPGTYLDHAPGPQQKDNTFVTR